ncbi:4-(cytidine 5'-diphospho)-2-C-methyl-D-erythritol kinase [Penaeicola halotolerans]|uniref:4-(cytidine 5'-diphospho)-2-C-methyl-D-erythritol kinase n=1 Tax=Penaeicola halotolerans TaxID=2793196 RepID=UPI001CF847EF|nr:4-(cytidine 5'-diphospho)-2-C-methyl-D-erythritol kinase [Penaeicola halotolerans]
MVVFPNCKINLGLRITSKRNDGYHDIESCFIPVAWTDALEIVPSSKKTSFEQSGITIPGEAQDNLCLKAFKLLQKDFQLPEVQIHLLKNIPIGAGLGGGSADAAFTLKVLDQLFELYLDDFILEEYAAKLGSDCAFFIKNTPQIATGRGEILEPITLPQLNGRQLLLINPNIHISTQEAYSGVKPKKSESSLKDILIDTPLHQWKEHVYNDFEDSIFPKYPELAKIKSKLYETGALYAAMSGSGSTLFGIFDRTPPKLDLPSNYQVWAGAL